jgi:hypothetical protein
MKSRVASLILATLPKLSSSSEHLRRRSFDCVLIGAGLHAPERLLLFEKLLNVVHAHAPTAKICFNTTPADSDEAVQRWV